MKYHVLYFFYFLILILPGCGKKPAASTFTSVQKTRESEKTLVSHEGLIQFKKKFPQAQFRNTPTHQALSRDILQVTVGLRDLVRCKPHPIPALSKGSLFQLEQLPLDFTMTCITEKNDLLKEITLSSNCSPRHGIFSLAKRKLAQHLYKPHLTCTITPKNETTLFTNEILEDIFDALEAGYASNEINIILSLNDRKETLCPQATDVSLKIDLQPKKITFYIEPCNLDPEKFIGTILDIQLPIKDKKIKDRVMKKNILFVLMPEGFQDLEFSKPYNALAKAGFTIDIAGLSSGVATGSAGTKVVPNKILTAMTPADFDSYEAIVIPGGNGSPSFLWNNKDLQSVVRHFHENKKLVATICYASIVPAQAGILENRTATVYPTQEAQNIFIKNNVIFDDTLCVNLEKERIVTAQSPLAIEPFIANILKQLETQKTEKDHAHA